MGQANSTNRPTAKFHHKLEGDELALSLTRKRLLGVENVPTVEWLTTVGRGFSAAISGLIAMGEDERRAPDGRPLVFVSVEALRLHPDAVAAMSSVDAEMLGLPPPTRYALDLQSKGLVTDADFCIKVRWVQPGGGPIQARVEGPFLHTSAGARRIPDPLFSIWKAAVPLSAPQPEATRFAALAELRSAIPEEARAPIETNAYLASIRIYYAAGLSLRIGRSSPFDFDPVLFSRRTIAENPEGDQLDEEADSILAPIAQKLFAEDRFRREPEARPVYVLRNGEYVFIDPPLRPVLNEVRRLQDASADERLYFIANPRRALREHFGDTEAERLGIDRLFVETEQFSARVAGVDLWRQPVLPWIKPSKNSWLPESFGLRIGDVYVTVSPNRAEELHERIEAAASEGRETIDAGGLLEAGLDGSPPPDVLPVNEQVRQAVDQLAQVAREGSDQPPRESADRAATQGKLFLLVRDNLEEVDFAPFEPESLHPSLPSEPVTSPARLRTKLKQHQEEGLAWLVASLRSGRAGVLLADDMGLGKTLQAIAFMTWLQEEAAGGRRQHSPFLVVAPTGLLQNWREEIDRHLEPPRLGEMVLAFGAGLNLLREEGFRERDIESGRASLMAAGWRDAGVVLTTYETLRDYHFSFARTRFGLIVFDEIQKLKNPASQVTRAAKTLNGDFALGMTGTPIENRLQDLWSIIDVVSPSLLGSSRDFERKYPPSDQSKLRDLKNFLTGSNADRPPAMLRRMKSDHLKGLPEKHEVRREIEMPPRQADAYANLVSRAVASRDLLSRWDGMLQLLHRMRGVSLHPVDPADAPADLEAYANDSARLSWTIELLEDVARKQEQALVFVESLAMQDKLAALIQSRFNLPHLPARINGTIPGAKRQELVNQFQARAGKFNVMILSPKAGGVGLNLTAANHVIHLSRWWNPAVEDQSTDRCYRIGQAKSVYVYLPLAVHGDPHLRSSSFDLKLDELLTRKRQLSRDMLLAPDGAEDDIIDLFEGVTGDGTGATHSAGGGLSEAPARPMRMAVDDIGTQDGKRLPGASSPRYFSARSGEPRPLQDILSIFRGRHLSRVHVVDPYALGGARETRAQRDFLRALAGVASVLEAVQIEYDPARCEDAADDLLNQLSTAFSGRSPPKIGLRPRRRTKSADFHDRAVLVESIEHGGSIMQHRLLMGRGLIGLMDTKFEFSAVYLPPDHAS